MTRGSRACMSAIICFGAALFAFASRSAAEVNFQGKTITLYAALGVGGGGDTMARTLIPYFQRNLPGEPVIVVRNMPGGGGIQGVQYLYNVAPHDGTAFGLTPGGPIKEPLMGSSGKATYDLRKFHWIGSLGAEDSVCAVWHTSPIASLQDARTNEVRLAATGAASNSALVPLLINDLAGTKLKPISGYDGGTSLLAVERGEMDGRCMSIASLRATRPNWISDHLVRFLFVTSESDDPDLKGVPAISALLKSDGDRRALKFFEMPDEIQDPFMLPPGVSAETVTAFRRAFDATVGNAAYLDDAKRHKQTIVSHNGEQVQATIQAMYDTPRDIVERVKRATSVEISKSGRKKEDGEKKR